MRYAILEVPLCVPAGSMWRHDWLKAVARAQTHRAEFRYVHP